MFWWLLRYTKCQEGVAFRAKSEDTAICRARKLTKDPEATITHCYGPDGAYQPCSAAKEIWVYPWTAYICPNAKTCPLKTRCPHGVPHRDGQWCIGEPGSCNPTGCVPTKKPDRRWALLE